MPKYKLLFPRWDEDMVSQRRTIVHLPCIPDMPDLQVGDSIIAVPESALADNGRWLVKKGVLLEIVEAAKARLIDSLADHADWMRLNLLSREASAVDYWARWNATNPDVPWESNPIVWRVVFRYLDGTEALTALAT